MYNPTTEETTQIQRIINDNSFDQWSITDTIPEEGLYLVHQKDNNVVRSMVVDYFNEKIICSSLCFDSPVVKQEVKDDEFTEYKFNRGIEGFIIRSFLYNGNIYFCTHRKFIVMITPSGSIVKMACSRWGRSKLFISIMEDLNFFEMIDDHGSNILYSKKLYSPYVHVFVFTHPDVLHVSKEMVGQGYISYMGSKKMDLVDGIKDIDDELHEPKNKTTEIQEAQELKHFYSPQPLTRDEVNYHLKYGYHPTRPVDSDPRLQFGEYVVAFSDEKARIIYSPAYEWRLSLRGDHPNFKYNFYTLSESSKIDTNTSSGFSEFQRRYPLFTQYDPTAISNSLKKGVIYLQWENGKISPSSISTPESRLYNIWISYIMAVPLHKQRELSSLYLDYFKSGNHAINLIVEKYQKGGYDSQSMTGKFIQSTLRTARQKDKGVIVFDELFKNIVRHRIFKQDQTQMYKVIKDTGAMVF